VTTPADLDERYGRTPSAARRTRVIIVVAAIVFAVLFAAWLVWGGLLGAPAQLQSRDLAHDILSDRAVTVEWEVTVEPGTDARCAVQALNATFAIVGWKVVDLPAGQQWTRTFSETVLTTEQAVTGLIYRCWLT
jgi:hypothetical protein